LTALWLHTDRVEQRVGNGGLEAEDKVRVPPRIQPANSLLPQDPHCKGFVFRVSVFGFLFSVFCFLFSGFGFRFSVFGFRVQVSGFRVQGSGFRV